MRWSKFRAYSRAVNDRYQNFTDRVLSGKISLWDRIRLFFTFVLLLTVLGIVFVFSLALFIIFGAIAFIVACFLLCWSWIYRMLHPHAPSRNQLRPRIYIWTSDDLPPNDSREDSEEENIVDVEPRSKDQGF